MTISRTFEQAQNSSLLYNISILSHLAVVNAQLLLFNYLWTVFWKVWLTTLEASILIFSNCCSRTVQSALLQQLYSGQRFLSGCCDLTAVVWIILSHHNWYINADIHKLLYWSSPRYFHILLISIWLGHFACFVRLFLVFTQLQKMAVISFDTA